LADLILEQEKKEERWSGDDLIGRELLDSIRATRAYICKKTAVINIS
jgi:hypothetical protein